MNRGLLGFPRRRLIDRSLLGYPLGDPLYDSRMPPVGGMIAWWDASDSATIEIASGNDVSSWLDKSGNSYHQEQATGSLQPWWGTRFINGLDTMEFFGDADVDHFDGLPLANSHVVTTYLVGMYDSFPTGTGVPFSSSAGDGLELRLNQAGNGLFNTLQANVSVLHSGVAIPAASTPFAFCQRLDPSTIYHDLLGGTPSSVGDATALTGTGTRIGVDQTGTETWDGLIGEIIRYPSCHTDQEVAIMLQWLKHRWGLAG